ncbi:hypothetical protein EK21DRAFT_75470, partial [Setomelanomma holmii]
TQSILLEALERLSSATNLTTKFYIFVARLDNYDGNHDGLVHTVHHLKKVGMKMCVASQPWNVFEDAFGADDTRKLYLQDLNKENMQRHVNHKLRNHGNFPRIDPVQANGIIGEIVGRSQGVFLWVRLVVRSLAEGLRNCDSMKLLQQFPSDLDDFFRHMFSSLEIIHRPHLTHMYRVALAAGEPLSPVAYWFLDEIEDHPNQAIRLSKRDLRAMNALQVAEEMTIRINGRSKGLLELVQKTDFEPNPVRQRKVIIEARVDFLHRTVKDFITTTEI